MKIILPFTVLIVLLIIPSNSFAQKICNEEKMSQNDKILFNILLKKIKFGIQNKDKLKLANLCNFPLRCTYCQPYNSGKKYISKNDFLKKYSKIIFNNHLKDLLSGVNISKSIFKEIDNKDKKVVFSLTYVLVEPSKEWEGQQISLSIEKINGSFKIVSTSSIP